MKEGGGAGKSSPKRQRTRATLVIVEIAVSLTLLLAATLLLRSFSNLQRVNGGFFTPPNQIVTALVSPSNAKYKDSVAGVAFYDEVLRRARAIPGIVSASVADSLPPNRQGDADSFQIYGQTLPTGEWNPVISTVTVTPDYFQTLGIPLLRGRGFTELDNRKSAPVAIVSEAFERRFYPNASALGKRIKHGGPGSEDPWMEIVGVVGNVKYLGLTVDTDPAYYMPLAQNYFPRLFLAVRTSGEIFGLARQLGDTVHSVDPNVTLAQTGTMAQAMDSSLSEPRFDTLLLTAFGAIALLLATVGVYGLISYSVTQRTREIGIRMALGADRHDVLLTVIREGASLAAAGIALGIAASVVLTKLLSAMLFGVEATDPLTFGVASATMLVVVLLAAAVPAVRAARVSPVVALRYE